MTREEAIDIIKCLAWHRRPDEEDIEQTIKSLSAEPCEDTISRQAVLDKIKAEIDQLPSYVAKFAGGSFAIHIDKMGVLQIIDKYKAESEDTDEN